MKNAVIYSRFSSDMQREESIDAQIRACKYYAQNFGYNIVGMYVDKAKSGRSIRKRDQFQKMILDSGSGLFSAVLVHKLDRFGRNGVETLENKRLLEQNGVELVSVVERLDQTPQGKLMLYIIVGMNEFYSANLAQETMKGLKENAYKCLYTGGIPPLGYDVNPDKTFRINETEAEAVRLIFRMYADGCGYTEILSALNNRGCKTKRGKSFGANSLHDLLTNEKYAGVYVFNKSSSRDARGRMNRHKYKTADQIIRVPDGIPAIVTPELWKDVQIRMQENRHKAAKYKAKIEYLLTGKIYCGICGSAMTGEVRRANGREYAYYRCGRGKRLHDCTQHSIPKDLVEQNVIDQVNQKIFSQKNIDAICNRIYISYQKTNGCRAIEELKRRVDSVERKIENITKAIANGVTASEMTDMLNDLSQQKKKMQLQLYELEAVPGAEKKSLEEIKAEFSEFADFKKISPEQQKKILQKFIDRVIVYPEDGGYKIRVIISSKDAAVDEALKYVDLGGNESSPPQKTKSSASAFGLFSALARKNSRKCLSHKKDCVIIRALF
ncbi:recombinase family protein [Caproicibacterium sp. XB1]|uniref:recombinase family protein n=1 Tax=Caproicibacterium sp. XB1 TaxID=3396405 RepID=UPI0039B6F734